MRGKNIPGEASEMFKLVMEGMGWDKKKTVLWFTTENPHFGGTTPLYLIEMGRGHKVMAFIKAALDENIPPGAKE